MNQPTEDQIKKLEEEVRQLREQRTEPIKPIDMQELLLQTNIKLDAIIQAQTGRSEKLETLEQGQQRLEQQLNAHAETWLKTVQENYTEHKQDISAMATKEDLKGMEKRLDAIAEVQKLILERLPKPPES